MTIVVGIDLGGTNVRAAAADSSGILAELRERTEPAGGEALLAQLERLARAAVGEAGHEWGAVAAASLGTAGVVAPGSLDVAVARNIDGWRDLRPHERLERALAVPVLVENDLNLAAVGEQWRGLARDARSFAFVGVGTGIGMGLVVGGQLVRGARGAAGELGYLPLADGARGAFEREVNGAGVVAAAAAHPGWAGEPPASAEAVFARAAAGDGPALEVVAAVGRRLGAAVAAVAAVVDPELVVLGGGVGGNELLLDPVRAAAAELLPLPPRVERSALGDRAPLLGAVALALRAASGSSRDLLDELDR